MTTVVNDPKKLFTEVSVRVKGSITKGSDERKLANSMDSQFYYLGDEDSDAGCYDMEDKVWDQTDAAACSLISTVLINNTTNTLQPMNQVPNWHRNRDLTFTVNVGLKDPDTVFDGIWNVGYANTLFLSDSLPIDEPTAGRHGLANRKGKWLDIYNLLEVMSHQQEIILDALNENVVQMDAMRVLVDPLDTVYYDGLETKLGEGEAFVDDGKDDGMSVCRHAYGHANWFVKARYLSSALWKCYPFNFRNIVIHGAAKMIAQDKLKVTKLQQFLAACGRQDTQIILVD